jgi:hypothetical protein
MFPPWIFIVRILPNLIPKSLRAGIALAVLVICLPAGLVKLSNVVIGQASTLDVIQCLGGLVVGGVAGVVFYYFQETDGRSEVKDLEIISQYHKDNKRNFEVIWTSEDHQPKGKRQN